ncbi:MAG: hypothetical protein J0L87_11320 [Bacteroidetes bacterium]|nr:hypothetical protein [Bacteroidota bacterium]
MLLNKKSLVLKGTMLIATSMLFVACGSDTPKEELTEEVAVDSTAVVEEETETTSYSLPSPLQIASIFKKSGLKYKDGVTSSQKDVAKYTTNLNKALNLGVYSADLSYSVLNKQNQEAMNYMKLCRQLADNLGMGSVFDQGNLSARFEKNLGNEDSLAYIIAELQMVTDMYLDENNQQQITSIVFAGAWVESLYIGSKVFEKSKSKDLNSKLAEQMTILESIVNALKAEEKKDANITGLIADMESVKTIYDALESVKKFQESTDENAEVTLSDEEVAQLTKKIEEVRTKFING